MISRTKTVLAIVAVATLTACSGSDEPDAEGTTASPTAASVAEREPTEVESSEPEPVADIDSQRLDAVREFVDIWLMNLAGPSNDPLATDVTPESFCQNVAGNGVYMSRDDMVGALLKGWADEGWYDVWEWTPSRQIAAETLVEACREFMF